MGKSLAIYWLLKIGGVLVGSAKSPNLWLRFSQHENRRDVYRITSATHKLWVYELCTTGPQLKTIFGYFGWLFEQFRNRKWMNEKYSRWMKLGRINVCDLIAFLVIGFRLDFSIWFCLFHWHNELLMESMKIGVDNLSVSTVSLTGSASQLAQKSLN